MTGPASEDLRACRALIKVALRRKLNRIAAGFARHGKKQTATVRGATPPKAAGNRVLFGVLTIGILFYSGLFTANFYSNLERVAGTPGTSGASLTAPAETAIRLAIPVLLTVVSLALLFLNAGMANRDLGQVEWSLEWLFTFPVKSRVLLLSQLAVHTLGNEWGWFIYFPFLCVSYWRAGFGYVSLLTALVCTLYLQLILAALRVFAETWLRKHLARAQLKNVQAVCTVVGIVLLFGSVWMVLGQGQQGPDALLLCGRALGAPLAWTPFAVPAQLCHGAATAVSASFVMVLYAVGFGLGGSAGAGRLIRTGLIAETGAYQGTRSPSAARRAGTDRLGWFRGIVAKDLRLLFRDRSFLVQTLFVPAAIISLQILINPGLLHAIGSSFNHAAMTAFGVGAYVLMFSASRVLVAEGKSLWLLYTLPVPIERVLLQKAVLWGVFATGFPLVVLIGSLTRLEAFEFQIAVNTFMVFLGLFIYALIAAGIGALGTNLSEDNPRRQIRPAMAYLIMFLAGFYSFAIYTPEIWNKAAMVILCSMLAYAVWQRVRDHAPYLLDPTQAPPPTISLADGLGAALAFFVVQGFCFGFLTAEGRLAPGPGLILAYGVAGISVVLLTSLILARRHVPALPERIGFRRTPEDRIPAAGKALLEGIGLGVAALVIGKAYTFGIDHVEPLIHMKEAMMPHVEQMPEGTGVWFVLLAVLLAPLFEEFIFRGLVFRGLRRSWPKGVAILASAAVFAVVHPPISMIPVFALGVATAVSFERTRLLAAPMIVHAVYNAGILLL
ncbi:MAG: CPBP family intramembrane metalloprotease [Planctomycetes bacterium]|nr:CPBP family intramembrane metalloprotease [Planctomycetota bacterium]